MKDIFVRDFELGALDLKRLISPSSPVMTHVRSSNFTYVPTIF
jgi:hypothetical protein